MRRSPQAIAKVKESIVSLLAKHPKGLRAEQIRAQLGLRKQEVPRPIADALSEKLVTRRARSGRRRISRSERGFGKSSRAQPYRPPIG